MLTTPNENVTGIQNVRFMSFGTFLGEHAAASVLPDSVSDKSAAQHPTHSAASVA